MAPRKPANKTTTKPVAKTSPPPPTIPVLGATPTSTPISNNDLTPTTNKPSAGIAPATAGAVPGASQPLGDLTVGTAEGPQKLVGDNSGLLGASATRRTIAQAQAGLAKMTSAQISHIQVNLQAAGLLPSYRNGYADPHTAAALRQALEDATGQGKSLPDYLSGLAGAVITKAASTAAAAIPSYADPAQIAVDLSNQFQSYLGRPPTAKEQQQFVTQIHNADESRKGTGVQVDVSSEAQLFAAQVAGGSAGSTTKLSVSTYADIDKSATSMGVPLSPTARANIAAQVDANARATGTPDVNLLNQLVAKQFKMPAAGAKALTGEAAVLATAIQTKFGDYLMPLTPATLASWVTKGITSQSYAGSPTGDTSAQVEEWLKQQAAIQHPQLAAATHNWATASPFQATAAYRTGISDTLGIGNPDSIDLTSAKYSSLIQADPKTNQMPTLSQMTEKLMSDPQYGFDSSPNGIAQGYSFGLSLAKSLGVNIGNI